MRRGAVVFAEGEPVWLSKRPNEPRRGQHWLRGRALPVRVVVVRRSRQREGRVIVRFADGHEQGVPAGTLRPLSVVDRLGLLAEGAP